MATSKKNKPETAGGDQGSGPSKTETEGSEKKKAGSKKKKHFLVMVYRSWCKRCGICAAFCPVKALRQDEETGHIIADNEKCIGCRRCERHCPDFSITIGVRGSDQNADKGEKELPE